MVCIVIIILVKHDFYLSSLSTLGSELVDLRLSNVSTLLSLLQLMLNLPELGHVGVGLLLLGGFWGKTSEAQFQLIHNNNWAMCDIIR